MKPRGEQGLQRCLVAVSLLAAAAAAQAPGAPSLKVEAVQTPENEGTGQYHGVAELRLSADHGAPLILRELKPNDDAPVPVPIPGPQFPIGREHVLLLGWSSVGSGTNDLHALFLHLTPKGVVLEHNLKLRMVRSRAVLVVRRIAPDAVLLGIPDWGIEKEVNSWETSLALGNGWGEGTRELRAGALRFVAADKQPTDAYYDPPFFNADRLAPARRRPCDQRGAGTAGTGRLAQCHQRRTRLETGVRGRSPGAPGAPVKGRGSPAPWRALVRSGPQPPVRNVTFS